jgi:hypothetical protein
MFDLSTLPKIKIKKGIYGDYRIVNNDNILALLQNHQPWMSLIVHSNNTIKQMYSSYDLSKGDVLLTGLGFGILPLWILNKETVNSVTVIEKSEEVIQMFIDANGIPENMTIINEDANTFKSDKKYDCVMLDHFELESNEGIIESVKSFSSRVSNHDLLWFWPLERIYADISYDYINKSIQKFPEISFESHFRYANYLSNEPEDFYEKWSEFKGSHLIGLKTPEISQEKINEYVYTFFNKIGYGGNHIEII